MIRGEVKQARDFIQRAVNWLNNDNIAALPDNQGPWEFEAGQRRVRLSEHRRETMLRADFISRNDVLAGQ